MKKLLFVWMVPVCVMMLSACEKDLVRGKGEIVTELRDTDNFTAVSVSGNTELYIRRGEELKVELRGYSNLMNYYSTRVGNGVLKLGYRDNVKVRNDNMKVYLTMPTLTGLEVSGVADVEIEGAFPHVPEFHTTISGDADVDFEGTGSTDKFQLTISGSAEIEAFQLVANDVKVKISGSATGKVYAQNHLDVDISGSATLYYKGNPEIKTNISGEGKLVKVN